MTQAERPQTAFVQRGDQRLGQREHGTGLASDHEHGVARPGGVQPGGRGTDESGRSGGEHREAAIDMGSGTRYRRSITWWSPTRI